MNHRLPIPVGLEADELLSSWLVRLALANGCDPLALTSDIWPDWRPWIIDLDRAPSPERISVLTKRTGNSEERLHAATLAQTARVLFGEDPPLNNVWSWILSLGCRNRLRNAGPQFCPQCLSEGVPYFRREWRYAWHVACERHQVYLQSCCPHCLSHIEYHRLIAEDADISRCSRCKRSLLNANQQVQCAGTLIQFQSSIDAGLVSGNIVVNGQPLKTASAMSVLSCYVSVLHAAMFQKQTGLRAFVADLGIQFAEDVLVEIERVEFERVEIGARSLLLDAVRKIVQLTQPELINRMKGAGVTQSSLVGLRKGFPSELRVVLDELEQGQTFRKKRPTKKVGLLPPPRSRRVVERMWRRLQKKMALMS